MKSLLLKQAALESIQQKTNVAMYTTGAAAVATSFVESINPFIPTIGITISLIFGAINVYINIKRYKLSERKNARED